MKKGVKGCPMIRMGECVSVSSGTGLPGWSRIKGFKRLLLLSHANVSNYHRHGTLKWLASE